MSRSLWMTWSCSFSAPLCIMYFIISGSRSGLYSSMIKVFAFGPILNFVLSDFRIKFENSVARGISFVYNNSSNIIHKPEFLPENLVKK